MENKTNIKNRTLISTNRGFTLVELLAMIALLSVISVIAIYTSMSIIGNTKSKSYIVTINNVQKEASTYVLENNKNIFWLSYDSNYLYQCITVQNLIDMGYFDNTILNSKIGEDRKILPNDYIYVEKEKDTNVITKNILLYAANSGYGSLCGDYVNAEGAILFDVPIGWAKSKEVTITYKLANDVSIGDSFNYSYSYFFGENPDNYEKYKFNNVKTVSQSVTIQNNGTLNAQIVKNDGSPLVTYSTEITEIDNLGPDVSVSVNDGIVSGKTTIQINITDNESGLNEDSVSLEDFKVKVGNNFLTSGLSLEKISNGNYKLNIENYDYEGDVVIYIDKDKILDSVGNGNDAVNLSTSVTFVKEYKISYNANGGSGSMTNIKCIYDRECTLTKNTYQRTGYKFLGWSTDKNATSLMYVDEYRFEQFEYRNDITLYAIWNANTYNIVYDVNGGTGSMVNTSCTYDSDCILKDNSFTKTGYKFDGWNTKADGSGESYTDSDVVRNLVSNVNGSITLYAKWKSNDNMCTIGTTYENCLLNENRPGSLWTSTLSGDGYRFVGTKSNPPSNYICFGTSDKSTCTGGSGTYMYRIIGVFEEGGTKYLKLIKNSKVGGTHEIDNNFNSDNRWSRTTLYSSINGSGFLNNTTFVPNDTWKNKIVSRTWVSADTDLNGYNSSGIRLWTLTPAQIYCFEHNISSCKPSGGVYTSSSAKIGLMYVSDYALSLGSSAATTSISMEGYKSTLKTGWMYNYTNFSNSVSGVIEWTMTRGGYPVTGLTNARFYGIRLDGYSLAAENRYGAEHRPVFYMSASQKYAGGLGTASKPFIIVE